MVEKYNPMNFFRIFRINLRLRKIFEIFENYVRWYFSRPPSHYGICSVNTLNLEKLTAFRVLGVIFDETFSFVSHIDHLCTRAMSLVGFLKRSTTVFGNIWTISKLYKILVLPILQYVSPVWSLILKDQCKLLTTTMHGYLMHWISVLLKNFIGKMVSCLLIICRKVFWGVNVWGTFS